MKTHRLKVSIEHPLFGDVDIKYDFADNCIQFAEGFLLDLNSAIDGDVELFEKHNKDRNQKKKDRYYVDTKTLRLSSILLNGSMVTLFYVFKENNSMGKKNGYRIARGKTRQWSTSSTNPKMLKTYDIYPLDNIYIGW